MISVVYLYILRITYMYKKHQQKQLSVQVL
jgi:hypothetical protein